MERTRVKRATGLKLNFDQSLLVEVTLTPGIDIDTFDTAVQLTGSISFRERNVNDIFIIQIVKHLTQAAGKKVILFGGAQATNIIWQVLGLSRWEQIHP
jgi:hypothetical protein